MESFLHSRDQCDQMMEKKLPNFSQNRPKSSQITVYIEVVLLKIAQRVTRIFGLLLYEFFVNKKFKKSNLVTLVRLQIHYF